MKMYNLNLFFISISPWPLIISLNLLFLCMNLISCFYSKLDFFLLLNFFLLNLIMFFWWMDVIMESTYLGFHNNYIMVMTIYSMIFFIVSEIFFFISFFWTFFHSMFSPDVMIGSIWPCEGIQTINYFNLPLLNSLLLISSGCSITWSHYMMIINKLNESKFSLILTFMLGFLFIFCQIFEYFNSSFSFADGIFGSIFFLATGFHGIHVFIGASFILLMFFRMTKSHFSYIHILGFEFSIWYWHFVDVVWLYLYMMVYWLGS